MRLKYFELTYNIAISKLQPDPIHGGVIFMPGANQSNSTFLLYCQKHSIEKKNERLSQHIDEYLADKSKALGIIKDKQHIEKTVMVHLDIQTKK